jgi:hypothetical protein
MEPRSNQRDLPAWAAETGKTRRREGRPQGRPYYCPRFNHVPGESYSTTGTVTVTVNTPLA